MQSYSIVLLRSNPIIPHSDSHLNCCSNIPEFFSWGEQKRAWSSACPRSRPMFTGTIRSSVRWLPHCYQVITEMSYTSSLWNSRNIHVHAHRTALTSVLTHEGKEMQEIRFSCRLWKFQQKGICCGGLDSLHVADLSAWDLIIQQENISVS